MPKLTIGLCCPGVRRVQGKESEWFLFGATGSDCERLLGTSPDSGKSVEHDICVARGDASLIRVVSWDGQPRQIALWRGLSSSYQLYFSIFDGSVYVSDSFKYIVASLPSSCRAISDHALVDHFLFGQVPGTNTYAEKVQKVAHGQEVTIDLRGPSVATRTFDRVPADFMDEPTAARLESLDKALGDFVKDTVAPEGGVVLFSGGIDSTLMSSYLGPAVHGLNMRTRTTNLNAQLEEEYCRSAAGLLGIDCDVMVLDPDDYLDQLVTCIGALGCPPHAMHMVWFNEAFRQQPHYTYFIAERADALFGHGGRLARGASHFTSAPAFFLLRLLAGFLPHSERLKLRRLLPTAKLLREPPESMAGYAARNSTFTNFEHLLRIFSEKEIEERLQSRFDYALERVDLPTRYNSSFHRHFELAQWIDYFCEETFSLYRQCAHFNGKLAISPFISKEVLSLAARIPGEERYIKDGQGKYMLKRLLKMKLPKYDVNKRKAFPAVPFHAYYPEGPVGLVWQRYAMPDFLDGPVREIVVSRPDLLSWQALKYAIWEQEIRSANRLAVPTMAAEFHAPMDRASTES